MLHLSKTIMNALLSMHKTISVYSVKSGIKDK